MITREFNLYLHAGHSIPLVINVNQYDRGESWVFTLFNSDGTQYTPSSGAIVGIKSDNLGIINTATVDSQGRVVVAETQQMTAAVGKAVFELVIDDGTHGTANFVVLVEPKPGDNADLSESDISMIEEAIEAASTIKPYGSPLVASTVAGMTDETKVYVYTGSETGYTSGHWYYYDGSDWADGGVYNSVAVQTDTTLAISGMAADAKKTGDEINDLKSQIEQGGGGLTADVKSALMDVVNHIGAWTDGNAQTYIGALQSALYPPANLTSISAVFTQGSAVIYDTDSLETLRQYLVVTAHYSDNTSETVTTYTLSGTLTEGTSTITASYGGKSATFNVVVSESWTYTWEYTDGLPENNGLTKTVNGTVSIAMESNGLRIAVTESDSNDVKYEYNKNVATKHTRIVYEIGLIPVALSTVNGRGIRMNTGIGGTGADAAYGTQLALNVNGIQYLGQASGWSLLTSNTLSLNEESKIKIDQIDGSADIYVNETLVGTITSFREKIGFPALQFRNVNETIFRSFKVRCID